MQKRFPRRISLRFRDRTCERAEHRSLMLERRQMLEKHFVRYNVPSQVIASRVPVQRKI